MKYWIGVLTFVVVLLGIGYLNLYCCKMQFDGNSAGIIIAIVSAIISGAVCFWLGRMTAPNVPDEAPDNYKQEHSDNVTIRLD